MLLFLAGGMALWLLAAAFILSICRAAGRADRRSRGRRLTSGATASLAVAAVSLPLAADEAAAACANRDLPYEANPAVVREAMLCEIGDLRERRDARRLRANGELDVAAGLHAADMFQRRYFSHESPGGGDLADRARRSGFAQRGCSWGVGEVLAWGVRIAQHRARHDQGLAAQPVASPDPRLGALRPDRAGDAARHAVRRVPRRRHGRGRARPPPLLGGRGTTVSVRHMMRASSPSDHVRA